MVEATGLESTASRSPSMARCPYRIYCFKMFAGKHTDRQTDRMVIS
jgi:hypothetical protein